MKYILIYGIIKVIKIIFCERRVFMKKMISLLLSTAMLMILLASCAGNATTGTTVTTGTTGASNVTAATVSNVIYNSNVPGNTPPADINGEPLVKIYMYSWDGQRIEEEHIKGSAAKQLEEILTNARKTGETEEKFSDFEGSLTYENYSNILPETEITCGTVWVEAGGKLYRKVYNIDEAKSKFCLVESYLGEGEILDIGEEELGIYNKIKYYWPNDYYSGTYKDGVLNISHIYAAESKVKINVVYFEEGKIILDVTSSADGEFKVDLDATISSDNLLKGDAKKLDLRAGETQTVELTFSKPHNNSWDYYLTVAADNTKLYIRIDK